MAPEQQGLLDRCLRAEMRLLDHAILVRLTGGDPRRAETIMLKHATESRGELSAATALQLMRRRRQIVVPQHRRHRPERPHRRLQAGDERFKRLARRQRHIRPAAEAEDPFEEQVGKGLTLDRHAQRARVGEIERSLAPRDRRLLEIRFAIRPVLGAPVPDPPLQRPHLAGVKSPRMAITQPLEQREGLQPSLLVGCQMRHHLRLPHLRKRVCTRPPRPCGVGCGRPRSILPAPRRPLAHPSRCRGRFQGFAVHPLLPQPPNLRVRDHPVFLRENG